MARLDIKALWARLRPEESASRALRRRVRPKGRIRITREGWIFILISLAVGLAAIRSGNNLLFLILGMMLGLLLVSGILSELSLRGLRLDRVPPPALVAARPFLMGISVTNVKGRIASFSIEVEDIQEDRVLDKRCYFLKIPAGRTQSTAYRHAFARRGVYRFSGFKVSTKFPFALLRKSRIVALGQEVVVRPYTHPVALPPLEAIGRLGSHSSPRRGRAGDVYGLRELVPGDDLRDIHWRSSARRHRLLVREREAVRSQRVQIVVDHRLDLPAGESLVAGAEAVEQGITMAASLASALLHAGYHVSLVTLDGALPQDQGGAHLARILETLARLKYADAALALPTVSPAYLSLVVGPGGRVTSQGHGARRVQALQDMRPLATLPRFGQGAPS